MKNAQWLTVPVNHTDLREDRLLNEIRVLDDGWRRRHWKSIQMAYRRAPHFDDHADFLDDFYRRDFETITDLCLPFIEYTIDYLGLPHRPDLSSRLALGNFDRTTVIPAMCRAYGAKRFLAGPKAADYLERNLVEQAGVDIEFFHYENPKYRQLHPGFVQRLSALDAMMNCGRQTAALIEWSTPHACDGSRRPPG